MLSSRKRACAHRRRWILAALFAAQGISIPAWSLGAEPGVRRAASGLFARASSDAELPPIVAPNGTQRPRPTKTAHVPSEELRAPAHRPLSRIARMQAAAADMLSPPAAIVDEANEAGRRQTSPWMQDIDPDMRSKPVPATAVSQVRYHAGLQDDTDADAATVAPVVSDDATDEEAGSRPDARSGIGKPSSLLGGQLPRIFGTSSNSAASSRRTFAPRTPARYSEATEAREPTPVAALNQAAEPMAKADDAQGEECRQLEERLGQLFPDREIQILIGRDHASASDETDGEIIAIIRKPAGHRGARKFATETDSVR